MAEVAENFKNHGNELYGQKTYRDAVDAYTSGLEAGPSKTLRISLLNNRAAANLAMKNYRDVLRDTSGIIALCAGDKVSPPGKAVYRAAQALVGLEKWEEAADAVEHGRKIEGEEKNEKLWAELSGKISTGKRRVFERTERERRKTLTDMARSKAVVERGLIVVNTPSPPDNPHPLDFDPAAIPEVPMTEEGKDVWTPPASHTPLVFPVFVLYPQYQQSDLITHFQEDTSFAQQLEVIFPASPSSTSPPWSEWDAKHEYYTENLVVYVETRGKRLLKVGKDITLREVIAKAVKAADGGRDGIVLRDGLMSFVVLVKGKEEREWIDNFKKVRDGK